MFLKDEHEETLVKSKNLIGVFNEIEKHIGGLHKESIVTVK